MTTHRSIDLVARGLLRAGASLGRLLADGQLETRCQVLDVSVVRAEAVSEQVGVRSSVRLVRRTYTIVVGGQSVAAVSEWFCPGRLAAARPAGSENGTAWRPFRSSDEGPRSGFGSDFVVDL